MQVGFNYYCIPTLLAVDVLEESEGNVQFQPSGVKVIKLEFEKGEIMFLCNYIIIIIFHHRKVHRHQDLCLALFCLMLADVYVHMDVFSFSDFLIMLQGKGGQIIYIRPNYDYDYDCMYYLISTLCKESGS